jgi:pimeloyl-ACP methyl ester carboxylesterase
VVDVTTFVLVHGAWGGSYAFRAVRRLLHADGHEVITPSLTGIGERAHLTGPHVDLSLHVLDVVNAVRYEDLHDIVLLGYSYGGMVITGALDPIGDRVRELVYLDAFVPADGQSLVTLAGGEPAGLPELGAPWSAPTPARDYEDPAVAERARVRRVPQPLGTFAEPVRASVPLEERGKGLTYIRATADPDGSTFEPFAEHARLSPAWRYHEIATTHMIPENRPEELAAILRTLAVPAGETHS